MSTGKFTILLLISCFLCSLAGPALAVPPPPVSATCRITCTVSEIVEWSETTFPDIDLGELNTQKKQAAGESSLTLYTNGDVTITADNSSSAEMSSGPYTLQTEYQLRCDGSGVEQTGGRPSEWCTFDTFLKEAAEIIHIPTDGEVEIILSVKASVKDIRPEDTGSYNAIQTLTACWKS